MVDTTPFKICIQRAETRQEWDAMQDDYINRAVAAADRIEKLEAALREIAAASKVIVKAEDMAQALVVVLTSHRKIALAALEGKNE